MRVSARKSIGEGINPPCCGAEVALNSSAPSIAKASAATALLHELAQERERQRLLEESRLLEERRWEAWLGA
jgi:hypothetical protein